MKKIIRLTENDLTKIINRIINEQNKQQIKMELNCVPFLFRGPITQLINENYNKLLLKTALGVIGRESDFGNSTRYKFLSPLKTLTAVVGGDASVGYGQIRPETAKEFGLSVYDLTTALGALKGVYKILSKNYNLAIKEGYSTSEGSSNFKDGTGNAALDMAIVAFNAGSQKITKYCETNDPNVKRNCKFAGKLVEQGTKYTVTDKLVKNYLPNFKTNRWDGVNITTHGYVKEVSNRIKTYNCF
jgi:hypothetical protein